MIVWGHRDRHNIDGVTADSDFECPKCTYIGRLLLFQARRRSSVYFIPLGFTERTVGGAMACPVCSNTFPLGRGSTAR
jgi:hypothetical protein